MLLQKYIYIYLLYIYLDIRLVDFGLETYDPLRYENVLIGVDCAATGKPQIVIMSNGNYHATTSNSALRIKKWDHFAFTLSGSVGSIYINGKLVGQSSQYPPRLYTRIYNYIGKDNSISNVAMINAELDDIKIFNKSLTNSEILMVMNSFY